MEKDRPYIFSSAKDNSRGETDNYVADLCRLLCIFAIVFYSLRNNLFIFYFMYKRILKKEQFTFHRFANKRYAAFASLHREIRIGALAIAMLGVAHNAAVASRTDSVDNARQHLGIEEQQLDEVMVSASRVPVTAGESATKVEVLTREDIQQAHVQTVNDLLKLCASVDVRQRGALGIQTDIGIGGGTFDQVAILLNGISITNPQTGHLSADFFVGMDDIERIEIYDGATARTFGSQALNGAINIITRKKKEDTVGLHTLAGSYGTAGLGGFAHLQLRKGLTNRLSSDYLRSDGATRNSDMQKLRAYYQGLYQNQQMDLQWQAGYSYMRYGANTFYSSAYPNQWERNNRILASVKGHTSQGPVHLEPSLSWIRSYDHFQLIRRTHTAENFHRNDVFTGGLNAYTRWALGRTAFGGEIRYEGIVSTNLGTPMDSSQYVKVEGHDNIYYARQSDRTNISLYIDHMAILGPWSISLGILANRNTSIGQRFRFYPGVDLSYRLTDNIKLYTSWNKSMRLPTFTDLYYHSPTQRGNIGLKPEQASTLKAGTEWQSPLLLLSLQGAYRHGKNMIDWVMYSADDIYHSTQFRLDNYQIQAKAKVNLVRLLGAHQPLRTFQAGYSYIYQKRHDDQPIYKSNYALEYLRHKLLVSLHHMIWRDLSAGWYLSWQDRTGGYLTKKSDGTTHIKGYSPYMLLNAKVDWIRPTYEAYLSLDNLTSHRYYDFGSVPQPGFTCIVGLKLHFGNISNSVSSRQTR